ncbi:MAG: sigma-70 family RNA polymerase sigma factor [Treponema sp.]|nr:sigma-70 family RNA polymerase sigma factor [Treponema sp.]
MRSDVFRSIEQTIVARRDAALVKSVLAGDSRSFARLMALYKKRVLALGMSFFKNATDSDDFVQDVFIKVYQNIARFRGESSFSTWLMRIAYTTALNAVNRRREAASIADEVLISDADFTPEEKQIRRITVEAVNEALRELPEKYAVCLELYFYYDIPYEEIAVITGYPVNTLKSHIFRAKKLLREKLRGFYEN